MNLIQFRLLLQKILNLKTLKPILVKETAALIIQNATNY